MIAFLLYVIVNLLVALYATLREDYNGPVSLLSTVIIALIFTPAAIITKIVRWFSA